MTAIRFARFHVEPADADEMINKRALLVDAIRHRFPGLTRTHLTRLGERTWLDIWRWESHADLQRALEAGPTLAEAPAVFALAQELSTEDADLVDER
ncbi:MAG: antibiotic biosynthesis monooxygenase [Pseudonocardia sp.]|nr:antibiotic biosynthesis monooxygenase [Pseudonocardia sp.]